METNTTQSATEVNHSSLNLNGIDQFLTFILGDETFGIDILRVQEIKGWEETTKIPNMPEYVKGVIDLRGVVIPIVDLRQKFGMEFLSYDTSTVVIIVQVKRSDNTIKSVGLVVDSVSDVEDIDLSKLQASPQFIESRTESEYITGLATLNNKMIIILSVDDLVNAGLFA